MRRQRFPFPALCPGVVAALLARTASAQTQTQLTVPVERPAEVAAPPDTVPFGYERDARGRTMQTRFDMNRRVWIGGMWSPSFGYGDAERRHLQSGGVEIGTRIESLSNDGRYRGRYRLLEGGAQLGPLSAKGTLLRYDESRETRTPILRLSTFWPRPARHDLYLNLGVWGEAMGIEYRPRASADETNLRLGALGASWDLWHDAALEDYLRLRVGAALEDHIDGTNDGVLRGTGIARAETDVVVDDRGFHRLTADVGLETPIAFEGEDAAIVRRRFGGSLGYELIVLAVNDQPVTLRAAALGGYRDDLAPAVRGWEVGGEVGMRVSFWAPPPQPRPARAAKTTP